jgi:DNA-binding transcriptional regulator YhcF (GntR family)
MAHRFAHRELDETTTHADGFSGRDNRAWEKWMATSSNEIAEALRERIINQIRMGALEYGDRLPSARELSVELGIDPRTALAAYHTLAEEDLVELRRRSGVYVAARPGPSQSLLAPPVRWMVETLADGIARDIPVPVLAERFREATTTVRMRAAVVECNRDQIHSMSRELREDYGFDASGVDLTTFHPEGPYPRELEQADIIVSAAHGDVIRTIATTLGKPFVVTSVRSDLVQRTTRLLARGPVYFVMADPRFAEKLRRGFASLPSGENFHAVVVGRDDIAAIPDDATTYVMLLARELLGDTVVPGRLVPPVRVFSPECAREILGIMVRRNAAAMWRDGGDESEVQPGADRQIGG